MAVKKTTAHLNRPYRKTVNMYIVHWIFKICNIVISAQWQKNMAAQWQCHNNNFTSLAQNQCFVSIEFPLKTMYDETWCIATTFSCSGSSAWASHSFKYLASYSHPAFFQGILKYVLTTNTKLTKTALSKAKIELLNLLLREHEKKKI